MKILIVGDSHVDTTDEYLKNSKTSVCFGDLLAKQLTGMGHDVTIAGVGGSKVKDWLGDTVSRKGKSVNTADLPKSPDLLIAVLGSNDMGKGMTAEEVVSVFPKLVTKYGAKSYMWVGPPRMRTKTAYSNANMDKLYKAALAESIPMFDSRVPTGQMVDAGSGDGVHVGPDAADAWADSVAAAIGSGSARGGGETNPLLIVGGAVLLAVALAFARKKK